MFDTFISYRRVGGGAIAARAYDYLKLKGYRPFYDITGMTSGRFDEQLKHHLIASQNYVLILSKGALDRCSDDEDWVLKEIVTAIDHNLNIIVLKEECFSYPDNLRSELSTLPMFQAIEYNEQTLSARLEILCGMLNRPHSTEEAPIYDTDGRKKFKISDEYMSYYEDIEDGKVVMRRAPVVLKSFLGRIKGKTWFSAEQAWSIRARMYGKKRMAGTYFARSSIDEGIGTFFLNVIDSNTLEGFWSGYDNANNILTSGKYIFKRKYKAYTIRKATVSDFPGVIRIADAQLGSGYLTKERLEMTLEKSLSDEIIVAVQNATNTVIGFSIYNHLTYEQAQTVCPGLDLRKLMFAKQIGYVATVATAEAFKGLGIGSALVEKSLYAMKENGINCFISTAWKHMGKINIGSVLENHGFKKDAELPKYWYESSLRDGYLCPECGNPCTCSCVVYTKV